MGPSKHNETFFLQNHYNTFKIYCKNHYNTFQIECFEGLFPDVNIKKNIFQKPQHLKNVFPKKFPELFGYINIDLFGFKNSLQIISANCCFKKNITCELHF